MEQLLYFLFGISFIYYFHPLLDRIFASLASLFDWMQSYFQLKMTNNAVKIAKLERKVIDEEESTNNNPIGFCVGEEIDDKEDYYDDDDDI